MSGPLPVRRLDPRATLPSRAYRGDAGLDLYALEEAVLDPGERASIRTGIGRNRRRRISGYLGSMGVCMDHI